MNVFSKAMAVLCGLSLMTSTVPLISAGAVEDVAQADTNDAISPAGKKAEKNVKIGKVTAVNGNVITVSLGEFTSRASDAVVSGTVTAEGSRSKKQKSAAENVTVDSENQTVQKAGSRKSINDNSGDNTSEHSQKRSGKPGRSGTFTENGTTLDVIITDGVTIEKKGEEVAISDVSEGDLLKLVYDENDNLVKVKFTKNKGGHGKAINDIKGNADQMITGETAES